MLVGQSPETVPDSRSGRRFREVIAYWTERLEDFFDVVLIVIDAGEARSDRQVAGINSNSALYRDALWLPTVSGDPSTWTVSGYPTFLDSAGPTDITITGESAVSGVPAVAFVEEFLPVTYDLDPTKVWPFK